MATPRPVEISLADLSTLMSALLDSWSYDTTPYAPRPISLLILYFSIILDIAVYCLYII